MKIENESVHRDLVVDPFGFREIIRHLAQAFGRLVDEKQLLEELTPALEVAEEHLARIEEQTEQRSVELSNCLTRLAADREMIRQLVANQKDDSAALAMALRAVQLLNQSETEAMKWHRCQ